MKKAAPKSMASKSIFFATIFIACWAVLDRASAQNDLQTPAACPEAGEVGVAELLGLWRAEFEDGAAGATLLLEKNANWAGSFGGAINRGGQRAQVAGDVEDGEFTMEESADGVRIGATWLGDVVPGSCGREIRGTWQADGGAPQATGDRPPRAFVLRRLAPR